MAKGISIHIGVDRPDSAHFPDPLEPLLGAVNDANAMHELAAERGFAERHLLLGAQATAKRLEQLIDDAAGTLADGDLLLLTFAGHGGRMPRDPAPDGLADVLQLDAELDQTWCLHDRELLDDELLDYWRRFARGVRILVVSDSCYSGSIIRLAPGLPSPPVVANQPRERGLPPPMAAAVFQTHEVLYRGIQDGLPSPRCPKVEASVILLAACEDCEKALDGDPHGHFTDALLATWNGGAFKGSLLDFHAQIYERLRVQQRPTYMKLGAPMPRFDLGDPFTI